MSAHDADTPAALGPLARRLIACVDLTSLNEQDDEHTIRRLASLADTAGGRVAALCTWGRLVPCARAALGNLDIPVAAVANFPGGAADAGAAAAETLAAVAAGAREIDVVFPYRALLGGDKNSGLRLVQACRDACAGTVKLKVILETGQLRDAPKIREAAQIAIDGGADFLKTSTGKTEPGATLEASGVLIEALAAQPARPQPVGLKVSGGIRALSQARVYLEQYEQRFGPGSARPDNFRIGASALLRELLGAAGVSAP